jgi:hypothetical protein
MNANAGWMDGAEYGCLAAEDPDILACRFNCLGFSSRIATTIEQAVIGYKKSLDDEKVKFS